MISEYKETFENYKNFEEFYYPSVCHVCKLKGQSLKTCKSCKAYRYCTVEHQRIHWPTHKKICKLLNKSLDICKQTNINDSLKSSLHSRIAMKILLEQGLARPLMPAENQVWMFPRVCPICKVTADVMIDCQHCPSVSYCSAQHQLEDKQVHSKLCGAMNLQYKLYCSRLNESSDVMLNRNVAIQEVLEVFSSAAEGIQTIDIQQVRLADRLSHVLTIMNALNICGIIHDNRTSHNHLIIHVVGVTYECLNFNRLICELIFHWIGNLKTLDLVFIGPELADRWIPEWDYCKSCVDRDIVVNYSFEPTLYSQYSSSNRYLVPSIISIFNCGFHELDNSEFDLWGDTLPLLLIPNVPVILTSYTSSESIQDLNRLKDIFEDTCSVDLLRECEKNAFHSPVPLRDWINPEEIYFNNYYFSLIKKK